MDKMDILFILFVILMAGFVGFVTYYAKESGYDLVFIPLSEGRLIILPIKEKK